jgi:hypothetical protein
MLLVSFFRSRKCVWFFSISRHASSGPSEFNFPSNSGPSSGYNFDGGDASM